ncbi:MAG: formylmethanofuran dehydrogenase subunit C [Gemmataceae bacterium]|nr:formylmethanofuran dehydrogenase subunit C [Gemmataceae bacterium]
MQLTATTAKTVLTLKQRPHIPLEAEVLTPDRLAFKTRDEIAALPLVLGKRQVRVDDYFDVEGDGSHELEIHGDVGRVKWIGRGMTRGRIVIRGNAGMHLGAFMSGGAIEVDGNASDWVGGEMRGGLIRVTGNAGGQIGAAYRGSMSGMRDGTILIGGTAGLEVGMRMKRGIIAIRGKVKDFAGLQMKGGTIVLMSGAEIRTGAWMVRGTIISLAPLRLLPTFAFTSAYDPTFLNLYSKCLAPYGFALPRAGKEGIYRRYMGDSAVPGKGELLVWQPNSP